MHVLPWQQPVGHVVALQPVTTSGCASVPDVSGGASTADWSAGASPAAWSEGASPVD
jgi:hypothetical protein